LGSAAAAEDKSAETFPDQTTPRRHASGKNKEGRNRNSLNDVDFWEQFGEQHFFISVKYYSYRKRKNPFYVIIPPIVFIQVYK
jgi:hypothetical protein